MYSPGSCGVPAQREPDAIGKIEKSDLLKMWFTQYHCPAVQLREDILGPVWNRPGRWQEAENGGKRRHLSKDGGNWVAVVIRAC